MLIREADLAAQYERANRLWPYLHTIEFFHRLPRHLLFALGSRETNLDPAYTRGSRGDNGHGRGLFQLDDRYHVIPKNFDVSPRAQARAAAGILNGNRRAVKPFGIKTWVAAYNAGVGNALAGIRVKGDPDAYTTHGSDGVHSVGYATEVLARMQYLQEHFPKPTLRQRLARRKQAR